MGVIVAFDYNAWIARFPEFTATVSAPLATEYFNDATMYLANDGSGPIQVAAVQSRLLNLLTAHIAAMNAAGSSPLVGRISSASEGSVSVGTEYSASEAAAWFLQTKYGAQYWQATSSLRQMRYVAGPRATPLNGGGGYPPGYLPGIGRIYPW